jgi:hypothetical protein
VLATASANIVFNCDLVDSLDCIRFELSAIRMASRYILGALARYRWRGARSSKSRQEC